MGTLTEQQQKVSRILNYMGGTLIRQWWGGGGKTKKS